MSRSWLWVFSVGTGEFMPGFWHTHRLAEPERGTRRDPEFMHKYIANLILWLLFMAAPAQADFNLTSAAGDTLEVRE